MIKQEHDSTQQRGKGQTLAEFALTLPILLLLLFGIIEFGRLFQSWVTLQNAARTAVRYASTGQYKEDRYPIEELIICKQNTNQAVGDVGTAIYPLGRDFGTIEVDLYDPPPATSGEESEDFYASWYGSPTGCAPGTDTDQNRKDMLRLPSIYEEARRGAAGLLIEDTRVVPTYDSVKNYLYSQFQRPHPDVEKLDWFDVVICSSRDKLWSDDVTEIYDIDTGDPTTNPADTARFQLVLDRDEYEPAACVLREAPKPDYHATIPYNELVPWMDAGSPGDRVTVVITYNHRLITPIGLANMVTLQAQRSAINEAFRVSNAPTGPVPPPLPTSTEAPELDPVDTDTPDAPVVETNTYTPVPTDTDIPAIPTDEPFNCDNIDAFFREDPGPFNGNRFFIEFANFNAQPAYLMQSEIHWDKSAVEDEFPDIYLAAMALDAEVYWIGDDGEPPTIANDEGFLNYDPDDRSENNSIYLPEGGDKIDWQGQFILGPAFLYNYFTIYDFANTRFVFDHPDSDEDCDIRVYIPPIPTDTPEPVGYESPTPTYTPDCASLTLRVEFVSLEVAGDVTLRIINDGPRNAPFTGFNILWPPMSGVGLDRVVIGGKNALDTPEFGGDGVVMFNSPNPGGDTTNNTYASSRDPGGSEPNFITDVTVPAYSNTLVHLDFVGVAGKLPMSPSDLNGSRFDIWCGFPGTPFSGGPTSGSGGGGGSPGGDGEGSIFLAEENTPVPTGVQPPTWTPLPETLTPTFTPSPAPPTDTPEPLPTIPTLTPSNTPPATNTPTPTHTLPFGGEGSE